MVAIEALQLALKKENASVKLYQKLLVEHSAIKDLLSFLVIEEEKHVRMIEDKIRELLR